MMRSPSEEHASTAINAVLLTIAKNLRGEALHCAGYCPDIAKVFLYLLGLRTRMPMKSKS
jgi:hypothetical protein